MTALVTLLSLLGGALLLAFSGVFNISARRPHTAMFHKLAAVAMERSVKFHAPEVPSPDLSDSTLLKHGAGHFRTMCVQCHGTPGKEPSEIGKGLNPKPPELSKAGRQWSDSELHWIIRNGVKMTGMPAFGETHDEKEIWSLVAFIRAMSGLSPEKYQGLVDTLEGDSHPADEESGKRPETSAPWKKRSLF